MTEYAQLIVDSISKNLTGNYEDDMAMLHDASDKYKNDEESADILSAIAGMMFAIIPEDERTELEDRFNKMKSGVAADYEEVKEMIKAGELVNAKNTMETILSAVEGAFNENENSIYMSFNHVMELYIYSYYYNPVKEVKFADIPYNQYYRTYGSVLGQLELFTEAEKAYEKAMKWNPVDLDSILSLAEIYKFSNDLDNFLKTSKQVYKYACTRATMARYYRNLAYYYLEQYKPEIARALYVYSNIYFQTENADNELAYIEKALNTATPSYSLAELQKILAENEIEPGPDSTTIGIIYRVGQLMKEDGDNGLAKDCFSIVYDITQDAEVGEMLQRL